MSVRATITVDDDLWAKRAFGINFDVTDCDRHFGATSLTSRAAAERQFEARVRPVPLRGAKPTYATGVKICLETPTTQVLLDVETADDELTLHDGSVWVRNGWHVPAVSTSTSTDGLLPAAPARMPKYRPADARPKTGEFTHHSDKYRGTVGQNLMKVGRWNKKDQRYNRDEKTNAKVISLSEGHIEIDGGGWVRFPGTSDLTITEWE